MHVTTAQCLERQEALEMKIYRSVLHNKVPVTSTNINKKSSLGADSEQKKKLWGSRSQRVTLRSWHQQPLVIKRNSDKLNLFLRKKFAKINKRTRSSSASYMICYIQSRQWDVFTLAINSYSRLRSKIASIQTNFLCADNKFIKSSRWFTFSDTFA